MGFKKPSLLAFATLLAIGALLIGCGTDRGQMGTNTTSQGAQTVGDDQQQAGSLNISKVEVTVQVVGHGGITADEIKSDIESQLAEFDKSLADPNLTAAERVTLVQARASFINKINEHGTVRVEVRDSDSSIGSGTGAGDGSPPTGNAPPPAKEPIPVEPGD